MSDTRPPAPSGLEHLLAPAHVAVIGASRTPGKNGHRVAANLIRGGYQGRISLVGAAGGEIDGHRFLRSIADAPPQIDCALLVIPAEGSEEVVRSCADAGVRSIIIASVGFAELGTEAGRRRQQAIVEIVRAHGMRLLGPNTNGILNASRSIYLGYNTSHAEPMQAGCISVVSHSGALMTHLARRLAAHGTGLSKFVPVGNEADVTLLDVLEHLIEDEATRVVGLIVEGLSDGTRLKQLARRARARGKPIVALKLGRSTTGAASSLAHSSRLAGAARAYDALFDSLGIAGVSTVEAMAGGCALLAGRAPAAAADRRLLCISSSGGGAAMLADFADRHGMQLHGDASGRWDATVVERLSALGLPSAVLNPMDTGSLGGARKLGPVLEALSSAGIDGPTVLYTHTIQTPGAVEAIANAVIEHRRRSGSPVALITPGGLGAEVEGHYAGNGVVVFHDTATCFESIRCHVSTLPKPDVDRDRARPLAALGTAATLIAAARAAGRSLLSEIDSAAVLAAAGVPMVRSMRVGSLDAARAAARDVGFPVVLKALPSGIAHKADNDLVVTGIADVAALDRQYAALCERAAACGAPDDDVPIILQPMLRAQAELILGVTHETGLGHFLVIGQGGVLAEIVDDIVLIPLPADAGYIAGALAATTSGRVLSHLAARHGTDLPRELTALACRLDDLLQLVGISIRSIDVNPLLVHDGELTAVDALIVLEPTQSTQFEK